MLKVQPTDRIWWAYCRAHQGSIATATLDICTLVKMAMTGFVDHWWEKTPFFTWLLGTIFFGAMSVVFVYRFVMHAMDPQPFSLATLLTVLPVDILLSVFAFVFCLFQVIGACIFFGWVGRGFRYTCMLLWSGLVRCIPTIVMRIFCALAEAVQSVRRYCITDKMHMWRMVGNACIFVTCLSIVAFVLYASFTMSWVVGLDLAVLAGLVFAVPTSVLSPEPKNENGLVEPFFGSHSQF
jgi:hypothetical protein